jgi:hypothetical protein
MMREIKSSLDEVFPQSLKEWEDGFRNDVHAEGEIAIWLNIARTYAKCIREKKYSRAQRQDVFAILSNLATVGKEHILEVVQLRSLSKDKAKRIVDSITFVD